MKTHDMLPTKFLTKSDIGPGALVTFKGIEQVNVGKEEEPEMKYAAWFHELPRPLVLNKTNIQRMEFIAGTDDTDAWVGKQFVIYFDPTVEFGGKLVGGLRVRAPKGQLPEDALPF